METCLLHPGVETAQACERCGQPFCDACLVAFLGARRCAWCKQQALDEVQRPRPADPRPTVTIALCYDAVVGALAFVTGGLTVLRTFSTEYAAWGIAIGAALVLAGLANLVGMVFVRLGRPGAWNYQLALLIVGCLLLLPLPFAIPLLVFWTRRELRQYMEHGTLPARV